MASAARRRRAAPRILFRGSHALNPDTRSLRGIGALALLFVVLTVAAGAGLTESFDLRVTRALQARPAGWLDSAGWLLGWPATVEAASAVMLALAGFVGRRAARPAVLLLGAFALVVAVSVGLKLWMPHPGPPPEFHRGGWRHLPSAGLAPHNSYPSGHAARAAFLALLIAALARRRAVTLMAMALALAIMVSRVYTGTHRASDVIGGALLGTGAYLAAWRKAGAPSRIIDEACTPRGRLRRDER